MPCQPLNENNITLPPTPEDFSGSFAPNLPALQIPFPELDLENLFELFENLSFILPIGILKPHLSPGFSKNPIDAILSLLEKFMPFLMMYKFFLPLLNLLLCIIEVLCAIPNPFKIARAIIRLFRKCIPEFLSLFPVLAIPVMIISLLLLILALIEYIILRVASLIDVLIANINLLTKAASSLDNDGIIAITKKLGDLLCTFQNLFILFGVVLLIIEVIRSILKLNFHIPPCDSSSLGEDGCCTPDVCPFFIKNNKQISNIGKLQYFNKVSANSGISVPSGFPSITSTVREESWQFYDASLDYTLAFNNIIHAFDLPPGYHKIFFPSGVVYSATSSPDQVPYTIDVRLFYDPLVFSRSDGRGARYIIIKDCIVTVPPTDGVRAYNNNIVEPFSGTLILAGGTAYEDDGTTIMKVLPSDSVPGNINSIIHLSENISNTPLLLPTDGILFDDVRYTFKINHAALLAPVPLITVGCMPDVALARDSTNIIFGAQHNSKVDAFSKLADSGLPDANAAQECVFNAIEKFRNNVSVESAEELKVQIDACLNKFKNDTIIAITDVIRNGFSTYKSEFTLDPSIQFTTLPIKVSVTLKDQTGANLTDKLPEDSAKELAKDLSAKITLGSISSFVYDGYGLFNADITSDKSGNGTIKVSFQNNIFSTITNPDDINNPLSVSENELSYTFVESVNLNGQVRRDESDISASGVVGDG